MQDWEEGVEEADFFVGDGAENGDCCYCDEDEGRVSDCGCAGWE